MNDTFPAPVPSAPDGDALDGIADRLDAMAAELCELVTVLPQDLSRRPVIDADQPTPAPATSSTEGLLAQLLAAVEKHEQDMPVEMVLDRVADRLGGLAAALHDQATAHRAEPLNRSHDEVRP